MNHEPFPRFRALALIALSATVCAAAGVSQDHQPKVTESRTVRLTQTVTLKDIPTTAKQVRLWVPVPSDTAWQRVLECEVTSAPGNWKFVQQSQGRGNFVYTEIDNLQSDTASVVMNCTVRREAVYLPLESVAATSALQPALFEPELDNHAPLMEVDERIKSLADRLCGAEHDPARQALLLLKGVAENADHYSKDSTKPTCGRGAAEDCLDHGGGCCTDLHSLFIALARARGLPARMQYGYRLLDAKAGSDFDPGYRCWVEFFISGSGWVPTDVVASDNADESNPLRWASLSASRVWLWSGRSFDLTPPAKAGHIDTMLCGWAEIDGHAVDVLPAKDGTPSKLKRTVKFEVIEKSPASAVKMPE